MSHVSNDGRPKSGEPDLVDRFLALPPIWRIAAAGAVVVMAVLVAQDHVWPLADGWNREADRIARTIERGRNLDAALDPRIERIAVALGPIEVPRSAAPGATRLEETVGRICAAHGLDPKIDGRTGSRLPSNSPLSEVAGGRVERLVCELEFVAEPDTLMTVVRELEREPEIESISDLRIERIDDGPKLDVRLVVEAWVVPTRGGRS
jgi:hypothetical protein